MSLNAKRAALAAVCLVACAVATAAQAQSRVEPSVALLGGYAHAVTKSPWPYYRGGFGARGGISVSYFYLGATLVWHLGVSERASGKRNSFDAGYHAVYFGPEVGLDVVLNRFVVRPYLGLGALLLRGHTAVRGVTRRDDIDAFYLAPAVLGLYRVDRYFFGLDARVAMPVSEGVERWAAGGMGVVGMAL